MAIDDCYDRRALNDAGYIASAAKVVMLNEKLAAFSSTYTAFSRGAALH